MGLQRKNMANIAYPPLTKKKYTNRGCQW